MESFLSSDGLKLSFPTEPVPVQSARFYHVGKFIRSYQPEKIKSFKQLLKIYALEQLPDDFKLIDSPISIEVDFVFLPPQSLRKKDLKRIEDGEIVYKDKKPDITDNLMKGTVDALTKVVWTDDSRIVQVKSRKRYGTAPGIFINIITL